MRHASRPAGTPIGRALDLPAGIAYDDLREVVAAIDRVHGDGELPRIPVRLVPGATDFGRFRFDIDSGAPISIAINPNQPHRELSLLHEIGHFLDWQALGEGEDFGSTANQQLRPWRRAVVASNAFRTLSHINERGAVVVKGGGAPQLVTLTMDERVALTRFVRAEEFWARAYAQYMAQRMRLPGLVRSLAALRDRHPSRVYYPFQWDDDDFDPIVETIDALFRELGWRA